MTRTERYHRGLSIINRVYELQEIHKWSNQQTATAFASLDESLPIGLHTIGVCTGVVYAHDFILFKI